jgi:protein-L-isoaspartate(D-aspartate) O-methyltransferase
MDDRERMVKEIKERYNLVAPEVISVMLQVPRDKFVAKKYRDIAYSDRPVSIGYGQTMSQPYTVAFMTHLLIGNKKQGTRYKKLGKVLEVGTGSGYQAAILSHIFKKVYTIEIIRQLTDRAEKKLKKLGYKNVQVKKGSGEWGWEGEAPFDAIMVTAGIEKDIPEALIDQLKEGGVLVAPIGKGPDKEMTRITKIKNGKIKRQRYGIFNFVPFVKESN